MNATELIKQLTIEEKIKLVIGKSSWLTEDIERLNIPSVMMTDGPHGLRKEMPAELTKLNNLVANAAYKATLFPAEVLVAASFNPDVAYKMGEAIGKEAKSSNVSLILGPGVNIKRNPLCGRNFEYYSEDPVLAGTMASSFIKGIRSQDVKACVKHYAANNQETGRLKVDSVVDERTLHEIYLKAFKMVVDEGVDAVMACYNRVNGVYGCENKELLIDILREKWGFNGLVVSDWGAVNDIVKSIKNGLDLEMPHNNGSFDVLYQAYQNNEITEEEIDRAVTNVLNFVLSSDEPLLSTSPSVELLEENMEVARNIVTESIVLLKNDNILPLTENDNVLFIGEFVEKPRIQGGGSSNITIHKVDTVFDNLKDYTKNYEYIAKPSFTDDEVLQISKANKIVIFTGLTEDYESEGSDRFTFDFPQDQVELIDKIIMINPNVVISLTTGSPVKLPFKDKAKAIVNSYLCGCATGKPILDILFGKESPSGRLPETFALDIADYPSTYNFAKNNNASWYQESIFVGYRYFSTYNKEVAYPFGYGLSYAKFEYSDLTVTGSLDTQIKVSVKVKNVSNIKAKEVVQLYVANNDSMVYKARRELKRFVKIELVPFEEKRVTFDLNILDFSYYDVASQGEIVDDGIYGVQICQDAHTVLCRSKVTIQNGIIRASSVYPDEKGLFSDEDFMMLVNNPSPKDVIITKPFTLNNTFTELRNSFLGKIVYLFAKSAAKKIAKAKDESLRKMIMDSALNIPIRSIPALSNGALNNNQVAGIVEIANGKIFKGIKKLLSKEK